MRQNGPGSKSLLLTCTLCLLAGRSSAAAPTDLMTLAKQGESLTDKMAQSLRAKVEKNADDAESRAQLLGYNLFRKEAAHTARSLDILWTIQHHSADPLAGSVYCQLDPADDADGFKKAKAAWDQLVTAHPSDPPVLANAAAFLAATDFNAAEALLQQCITVEPKSPDWPERLAQLYEKQFTLHAADESRLAPAALQLRQSVYNLTKDPHRRFTVLVQMPGDALRSADLISAKRYARQLLATAVKFTNDPAYGDAIHLGNITLGQISLHAGKTEEAEEFLTAAIATPGSTTISTTGPDLSLARELLKKGERIPVRDYLVKCKKLWPAGNERLKSWIAALDSGGNPDF